MTLSPETVACAVARPLSRINILDSLQQNWDASACLAVATTCWISRSVWLYVTIPTLTFRTRGLPEFIPRFCACKAGSSSLRGKPAVKSGRSPAGRGLFARDRFERCGMRKSKKRFFRFLMDLSSFLQKPGLFLLTGYKRLAETCNEGERVNQQLRVKQGENHESPRSNQYWNRAGVRYQNVSRKIHKSGGLSRRKCLRRREDCSVGLSGLLSFRMPPVQEAAADRSGLE